MLTKSFTFKMSTHDGAWGNKVQAIKGLRTLTGLGLKEAKTEMITNCVNNDIEKYSIIPIRKEQILFESQLEL